MAASPGSIPLLSTVICMVKKVRFFKLVCKSNTKFHVTVGHTTIVANAVFYGADKTDTLDKVPVTSTGAVIGGEDKGIVIYACI